MTGAESAKVIGKEGRLHGAGVPWVISVVILDTRNSYGKDQLLVGPVGGEEAGTRLAAIWVEASRVEVMP